MQTATAPLYSFGHDPRSGWSGPGFPGVDGPNTLVLVFGAPEYSARPEPFDQLRRAFSSSCILGCSTAGEIRGDRLHDDSLSVAVIAFRHARLAIATAPVRTPADSVHAGEHLARQLERPDLRGVLVLSDGTRVNGSSLVRGMSNILPRSVPITGGLAGDGSRFRSTWVLKDGVPTEGLVSAVGFYADADRLHFGHGCQGGWDAFGPERVVTRSEGNILYELDHQPALPLYKKYLGDRAAGLPATALLFPLTVHDPANGRALVRTILSIDEATSAMIFAGDVPTGWRAQLMRANFDRLIEGASRSALLTRGRSAGPCLAIAVSCVGRRLVLGERTEEELESTLGVLPPGSVQVGFYSYGEISPLASGSCELHNQTMTITTIAET
jgi:hypothetical protein